MYRLSSTEYKNIGAPEHIIKWIQEGVPLPFKSTPEPCFHLNRVYCDSHAVFIDGEISRLLTIGAIREVKQKSHCVLSMRAVPKKNNKLHLVTDCRPVNEHIECPSFSQEGITAVSENLQEGDTLLTLDVKDGFHHIPLNASFQTYIGIAWRGKFYVWCVLCFGVSIAPYYFNKVIRPVAKYLRINNICLAYFVDDFLLMIRKHLVQQHLCFTRETFSKLGRR